jgi:RND family efflux transporter MFP subunit
MSVDLRARVTGGLVLVNCQPGQTVAKGDVLFLIDPRAYQAELDKAEAEVRAAQARVKARLEELRISQANQREGRVRSSQLQSQCEEAEAAMQAAEKTRDIAKFKVESASVKAPIDGTISGPVLGVGNVVIADTTSLGTLISTDPMYVYINVGQQTVLNFSRLNRQGKLTGGAKTGVTARVGLQDEPDFPREGQLNFFGIPVDQKGTARWRVRIANSDGLLVPGLSAQVRLVTSPPYKATLVAAQAFANLRGNGKADEADLFVVNDQHVVEGRPVKLGFMDGGLWVVKEGLRADEWVVIDELEPDKVGMKVDPERVAMPTQSFARRQGLQ